MDKGLLISASQVCGTPCYVFSAEDFFSRCALTAEAVAPAELCYCVKANPFLLACLPQSVRSLEVCSPGELELCVRAGVKPGMIVFSGVSKTLDSVTDALRLGVGVVTAESPRQLRLIDSAAAALGVTAPVLLRLSSGNQFGMDEEDIFAAARSRDEYKSLRFEGLHYFSGTQKRRAGKISDELERLCALSLSLERETGYTPKRLEYGPGLFSDYFGPEPDAAELELLSAAAEPIKRAAERFELTVELGRFLAAPCGAYLTSVQDVKLCGSRRFAIVDGGRHQMNYDGQTLGLQAPPVEVLSGGGDLPEEVTICGSLCAEGDRLAQNVTLPALREGSLLAFKRAGAYSVSEGMAMLLTRELPPVLLHRDGAFSRLRERAQTADLVFMPGSGGAKP